jgi:hypothetical protein
MKNYSCKILTRSVHLKSLELLEEMECAKIETLNKVMQVAV